MLSKLELLHFHRLSLALVFTSLLIWLLALLLISLDQPIANYAIYFMVVATTLGSASVLTVGFAHILFNSNK